MFVYIYMKNSIQPTPNCIHPPLPNFFLLPPTTLTHSPLKIKSIRALVSTPRISPAAAVIFCIYSRAAAVAAFAGQSSLARSLSAYICTTLFVLFLLLSCERERHARLSLSLAFFRACRARSWMDFYRARVIDLAEVHDCGEYVEKKKKKFFSVGGVWYMQGDV